MHNDLESKRQIPGRHPALLGGFIVEWVHKNGDSRFPLNVCQQPATMQWQTGACVCVILFSLISQVETKKEVFCRPGKHEHYVEQYGQCKKCDKCPPGWGYGKYQQVRHFPMLVHVCIYVWNSEGERCVQTLHVNNQKCWVFIMHSFYFTPKLTMHYFSNIVT